MKTLEHFSGACNGTLAPLDPPGGRDSVPSSDDLAGEYLLKARKEVRRRGSPAILEALAQSVDVEVRSDRPGVIQATHWPLGTSTTSGGLDGRPGQGRLFRGSLAEHAVQLHEWASRDPEVAHEELLARLRAKGASKDELRAAIKRASPARTLGYSIFGGRKEYEFGGRTGVFLDNDGEGPTDPLRSALKSAQIANLFQERPESGRSHLELFFSEPLYPTGLVYPLHRAPPREIGDDPISQWVAQTTGIVDVVTECDDFGERYSREVRGFSEAEKVAFDDYTRKLQEWKRRFYTPAIAWMLGVFSELGGLACRWIVYGARGEDGKPLPQRDLATHRALPEDRFSISHLGFDAMPAHHVLGIGYPYTRRASSDPVPITDYHDGYLIQPMRMLERTGFVAPTEVRGKALHRSYHADEFKRGSTTPVTPDEKAPLEKASTRDLDATQDALSTNSYSTEPRSLSSAHYRERRGLYVAIVAGFRAARAIRRTLNDRTIVTCPYSGGHSNGDETGTVIMGNGSIKCHHGSCASRTQNEFLSALPVDAQTAIVEALPGVLPDDFEALTLPSILRVAALVRRLDTPAFERSLDRLLNEDRLPRVGEQNRITQWYARVRGEKV